MAYFTDLFSPETYEAFSKSDRTITGFRKRQENAARRVKVGDKFICYMTKLSRWFGVLEVASECYHDATPRFYLDGGDPFDLRFHVKVIAWLPKEQAIPIRADHVWPHLSFTKGYDINTSYWTGKLRSSLATLDDADGRFLEELILAQLKNSTIYDFDAEEYQKLVTHRIRRLDKTVSVSVPRDAGSAVNEVAPAIVDVRESIKVQALLAGIGDRMGLRIWVPRNDRGAVLAEWKGDHQPLLEQLPLNYDDATLRTIEQIDILWLRGRAIVRAFEVEHTTSIYSGILRMADLLALQPNMDTKLHLVAPDARREKVFQELQRPVFSLLEKGPLSESCTYLSYESVSDLARQKFLAHMSDSVLDDYSEPAE